MGFIHKEGTPTLVVVAAATTLISGGLVLAEASTTALISGLSFCTGLSIFFLQFFRNPDRNTPANAKHVIAPADGKVVVIEEVDEPEFLKGRAIQVSIFMSPVNVHVNRSPVTGEVLYQKYHPGKYLVAWHPKSSTDNERTTVVMRADSGQMVLMRQIAGALARRIVCYAKPGMHYGQGEEFGFIKFGSRVDLFLPIGTKVLVKLGDVTRGGEMPIAEFL
jgi:phosphatidylserine decarboxylase